MKYHFVSCSTCVLCSSFMLSACSGGTPTAKTVAVAYVAHPSSHSISVINIPADQTVSTIEIGDSSVTTGTAKQSSPQNVAVSPDGSRAYVIDGISSVWVVDTQSRAVVATIPAGTSPQGVVISPDAKNVYVTTITCGTPPCVASVEVIDTATNAVTTTIPIGNAPIVSLLGIAISRDGTRVYVASGNDNDVWAIDTSTKSIMATIHTTNSNSADLAISPDGSRVYTIGPIIGPFVDTYFVDVINTQTNAQTGSILLGNQDVAVRMAISPDGGNAYVTTELGRVWVVDTTRNALMSTITVAAGNLLYDVAFTPDGTRVYMTSENNNIVYVMSTSTGDVLAAIPSNHPGGLAISGAN
jgi:YVTN family beta-propeller protein